MTHTCARPQTHRVPSYNYERPILRRQLPTHEEIARLAYFYWEQGGRRTATDVENWLRAERDLQDPLRYR